MERQAERYDQALGSLGERRVRSRRWTAAYTRLNREGSLSSVHLDPVHIGLSPTR